MRYLTAISLASLLMAAATSAAAQSPSRACPAGTLLFGYGGEYGCVKRGTNEVVVRCFVRSPCPVGSKSAGRRGGDNICCPSAFAPLKEKGPTLPTDPLKGPRYQKPKAAP